MTPRLDHIRYVCSLLIMIDCNSRIGREAHDSVARDALSSTCRIARRASISHMIRVMSDSAQCHMSILASRNARFVLGWFHIVRTCVTRVNHSARTRTGTGLDA